MMPAAAAPVRPLHALPHALPVLRARLTLRLLADANLPAYKGAMLRGGFGYAFQRASCPQGCWGAAGRCVAGTLCPYHWIFETPHLPHIPHLHDLQDVPRPFVIEPPVDGRTQYAAGDVLEFGLVLIGRGIDYLPYFIYGFEQLGKMGLGRRHTQARLERVEVLRPWQPIGHVIFQEGRVLPAAHDDWQTTHGLPVYDAAAVAAHAAGLPADLRIELRTPLRVKRGGAIHECSEAASESRPQKRMHSAQTKGGGAYIRALDLPAIIRAICWRINALSIFHGDGPWQVDHRALVEAARYVRVEQAQIRWEDWRRTSTRHSEPHTMPLGGIVGSAVLRGVPPEVRAVLVAGSVVHAGKACVFGHGGYGVSGVQGSRVGSQGSGVGG